MSSVVALHCLPGTVAGSVFAVRTLLTLVALVLTECVGVTIAWGRFHGALVTGKPNRGSGRLSWRRLPS
jgi:hypothetical protein